MSKVNTSINLDATVKREAQELFASLGMDLTTGITIFLKQAIREQRIPFEIKRDLPNQETLSALREYYDMLNNPAEYKRFISFCEAQKDVLKEE